MTKKLQITLDEEATKNYLEWVTALNQAHADEDLEWCGCNIRIELGGPYGSSAYSLDGEKPLEFGDVEVDLVE